MNYCIQCLLSTEPLQVGFSNMPSLAGLEEDSTISGSANRLLYYYEFREKWKQPFETLCYNKQGFDYSAYASRKSLAIHQLEN